MLEAEQARLKEEIQTFQKEKDELEFILETHRTYCGPSTVGGRTVGNTATVSSSSTGVAVGRAASADALSKMAAVRFLRSDNRDAPSTVSAAENTPVDSNCAVAVKSEVQEVAATSSPGSALASAPGGSRHRPTSLPALSASRSIVVTTSIPGMNVLTVGLDSLADGHTGLTPLTGIPSGPVVIVGMPRMKSSASTSDSNTVVGYL